MASLILPKKYGNLTKAIFEIALHGAIAIHALNDTNFSIVAMPRRNTN